MCQGLKKIIYKLFAAVSDMDDTFDPSKLSSEGWKLSLNYTPEVWTREPMNGEYYGT